MAYPTPAQIDDAIPLDGAPNRALANTLLKALLASLPKNANQSSNPKIVAFDSATNEMVVSELTAAMWSTQIKNSPVGQHVPISSVSSTPGQTANNFVQLNQSAKANTVAWRGAEGVLQVGAPTIDAHATTKKYVDGKLLPITEKLNDVPPFRLVATPPTTIDDAGQAWDVALTPDALFICVAPNTWRQIVLSGWE